MASVTTKEGYKDVLNKFFSFFGSSGLKMLLFKSAHTPDISDTYSTYTAIECDFSGYSAGGQDCVGWTFDSFTGTNRAKFLGPATNWTTTMAGTTNPVYGYAIYDTGGPWILCAEQFAGGPYTMGNLADSLTVTPYMTSYTE